MQSIMTPQQQFNQVARPEIQRSTFDRSHGLKTTFDAGKLIPIFVDEALPGDTINLSTNIFGRLSTPLKPIMDNIMIDIHYFSVPIRLVYENWQKLNGEQNNPDDHTNYIMPTTTSPEGGYGEQSLHDYLGLPTKIADMEHRADFIRAYQLIYNTWYRDENLQNSIDVPMDDGPDDPTDQYILPRGKRKDYFTSALPWAQKAQPVSIPIGDYAPVYRHNNSSNQDAFPGTTLSPFRRTKNASNFESASFSQSNAAYPNANMRSSVVSDDDAGSLDIWSKEEITLMGKQEKGSGLYADFTDTVVATVNQLREAFQVQKMYEKDARGGTRYTELLRAHFGVISPDARLQRPEFLGGTTININVNPIAQTSGTVDQSTPQGNLAAMGTFSSHSSGFVKSFTEHEIVIGIASARADLNYQQGLNRMWSRSTRFDFYWPSLAHLGEQSILSKEIFATGIEATDERVFGYQERYAEYRYKPSQVTGLFRSNAAQSLDVWHLSQDFEAPPFLNDDFIEERPPIDRILAVPSEPAFMMDVFFKLIHARPMPTFATPGLIDHF